MTNMQDQGWSPPIIEVAAGASRVAFLAFAMAAGLMGAVAVAGLFSDEMRGPALVIAGIPAAIAGGIAYGIRRRAQARRLSVHVEGVREQHGERTTSLRFGEIDAIEVKTWQMQGAHVGGVGALASVAVNTAINVAARTHRANLPYDATQVTIALSGAGRRIVLRKWDARWVDAYAEIRARVEPRLLAVARDQLARSGAAAFGPVQVGADEVTVGGNKRVAFGELDRIDVDHMRVWFRTQGKRRPAASVRVSRVPNLHVLLDLVGERTPTRPSA